MTSASEQRGHLSFLRAFATALGVGLAWYVAELLLTFATSRVLDYDAALFRFVRLLPWQLVLFGAIGVALGAAARWRRLDAAAAVWLALWAASSFFLGARFAEGLLRYRSLPAALAGVVAVGVALALLLALLARLGRWAPERLRSGWRWCAWVAWSAFFLLAMERAGPAIGLQENGLFGWVVFLQPTDALLAAAMGACALLLATLLRPLALPSAAALALGAAFAAYPRAEVQRAAPARAPAEHPDVIVVLVDTWRFDHLGANAGRPDLTPRLDALAAESIRFTRAWSPGNYTKLAMPGVLTSVSPKATGTRLADEVTTLAERLKQAGFATQGVSTNPLVSSDFGYHQGFDRFVDPSDTKRLLIGHMVQMLGEIFPGPGYATGVVSASLYYRTVADVRRAGMAMFDASPPPVFLYLHTMDLHGPYMPPRRYLPAGYRRGDFYSYYQFDQLSQKGVLGSEAFRPHLANLLHRYEAGARYTDELLGRVVDDLKARGRWDGAIVWILSDHGESFGEGDFAGHGGAANMTDTLLRVPLLLKLPRAAGIAPRVLDASVSTYDVVPTTLALLGLPPAELAFGEDLVPLLRSGQADANRVVVSYGRRPHGGERYASVRWPWKLEVTWEGSGARALSLYHLEQDPGETRDVAAEHPDVVAEIERALDAWRLREDEAGVRATAKGVDALTQEQLRRLGYVE